MTKRPRHIAMGTSEAVDYMDKEGRINGCLNELAFMESHCFNYAAGDRMYFTGCLGKLRGRRDSG